MNMDQLRGYAPGASDWLMLLGYHEPGDGGGGAFFWDANSTAADNVGTVIVPDSDFTLAPGDEVRIAIEGFGELRNPIVRV